MSYNPYGAVDWSNTLRCQAQHHDHAFSYERIVNAEFAGYCTATYSHYSGGFRASTLSEWTAAGSPNPDPGRPIGWGPPRRWPPEDFGMPVLPWPNLHFYTPAAEEVGLYANGTYGQHIQSLFVTTYLEGEGCLACGINGMAVAQNTSELPANQIHASAQQLIDRIIEHGGHATVNHPGGSPAAYMALNGFGSVEMFNNYHRNLDDFNGNDNYSNQMMVIWDHLLQYKSPRIWGVASNDWFSSWTPLGEYYPPTQFGPVTLRNRDRGKLQVLISSHDLASYRSAFEAGAFFAIVEDNMYKQLYPTVTGIAVNWNSIAISTALGTESVRWIGNGYVLGYSATLSLSDLPSGLVYVRAEINDGDGRTVYTQPFTLGPQGPPPPPGPSIPSLPPGAIALLALLLICAVHLRASRSAPDDT